MHWGGPVSLSDSELLSGVGPPRWTGYLPHTQVALSGTQGQLSGKAGSLSVCCPP